MYNKIENFLTENNVCFEQNNDNGKITYNLSQFNTVLNIVDFNNDYQRHDNCLILAENKKNGIKTITIFQDEIKNKFDIVIRRLLNIFGLNTQSIYARKTKVVKLDRLTKDIFLKKYHIQGTDISVDYYGLEYNNEIVSVITFKKGKVDGVIEMNRFASSVNVVGGFTKLLNHYVKQHKPTTIITFADMRWTPNLENSVYKKMGFTHVETQPPVYHYVKDGQRSNRQQFMKHKILERHPELDSNLTEHELTTQLGYKRVYDCGNFKFEMVYGEKVVVETVETPTVSKLDVRYKELDEKVLELFEKGYNKKQIREELGKVKSVVNSSLKRLNIDIINKKGCTQPTNIIADNEVEKRVNDRETNLQRFKINLSNKFGDSVNIVENTYINANTTATFICNQGHETKKRPSNALLQITHCTACEVTGRRLSYQDFVLKAKQIHGDKYEYLTEPKTYCGRKSKIDYECKIHGVVNQSAHNHLSGSGCPSCTTHQSSAEKEICQFLSDNGVRDIQTNRKHIDGKEIDILINGQTFGVEFNGLYFHREGALDIGVRVPSKKRSDYHSNKTNDCLKNNVDLIQVFEDDWIDNKIQVLNTLGYKLKLGQTEKIYAKNVVIGVISEKENVNFYNEHCFFKYAHSNTFYGAYYHNKLIAVLNFKDNTITNFVVAQKTVLVGGFSKMVQHHIKMVQPIIITALVNREYSPNFEKTVFFKCGFDLIETLPATFDYIRFKNGEKDFKLLKRLNKELVENNDTNYDFVANGFDRIWNCGYYFAKLDLSKTIEYRTIDNIEVVLSDNGGRVYRDLKDERLDSQVLKLVNQGQLMKDITQILQIDKKVLNRSYERLKLQRMRFSFTVEVQELIKTMYREGKQLKDITIAVNLIVKPSAGRGKINNFLIEQGLKNPNDNKLANNSKLNNKFFVNKLDENILNLFKLGNTATEIAKILKVQVSHVSQSMDKQGIQREKAPFREEIVDVINKLRSEGVTLKGIESYLNKQYLGIHGLAKIRIVVNGQK